LCFECEEGTYTNTYGASTCIFCAAGTFNDQTNQTICADCEVGTFYAGIGAYQCEECFPGTYQDDTAQDACKRCPPGEASDAIGATECVACLPGQYQDREAQTSCVACVNGTFSDQSARITCQDCEAGRYAANEGSTECALCPLGYAQDLEKSLSCNLCLPGTQSGSIEGAIECTACPDNSANPDYGQEACYPCPQSSTVNEDRTACLCDIGYAGEYTAVTDPITGDIDYDVQCRACPEGSVCDERGLIWGELEAAVGYWEANGTYYRCLLAVHCVGGTGCTGNNYESTETGACCANYRTGPICAVCIDGYTESGVDGECEPCKTDEGAVSFTAIVIAGGVVVMWLQYSFVLWTSKDLLDAAHIEDGLRGDRENFTLTEDDYNLVRELRYESMMTVNGPPPPKPEALYKLKILLTFIQILTNLSLSLEIDYPEQYLTFVNYFNPANLDFVSFTAADCISNAIDHYFKFYCWLLTPVFMIFMLWAVFFMPFKCSVTMNQEKSKMDKQKEMKRRRRETWRLIMFSLFLVYPSVSASIFSIFNCKTVEGETYLVADFNLKCYDDDWNAVAYPWALGAIFVYPIGVPVFIFSMLASYHWSVKAAKKVTGHSTCTVIMGMLGCGKHAEAGITFSRLHEKGVRAQLGFLYDCYETRVWYFELIDMAHKLGATSLIAFFPYEVQLPMAMVMMFAYLAVLLVMNPYIRKGDDRLHLVAQTELIMITMAGNVFESVDTVSDSMNWVLTFTLIFMVGSFFLWWCFSVKRILVKIIQRGRGDCSRRLQKCLRMKAEKTAKIRKVPFKQILDHTQYYLDRNQVTGPRKRVQLIAGVDKDGNAKVISFNMIQASASKATKTRRKFKRSQSSAKLDAYVPFGGPDASKGDFVPSSPNDASQYGGRNKRESLATAGGKHEVPTSPREAPPQGNAIRLEPLNKPVTTRQEESLDDLMN
jgi:hypothetical protein